MEYEDEVREDCRSISGIVQHFRLVQSFYSYLDGHI